MNSLPQFRYFAIVAAVACLFAETAFSAAEPAAAPRVDVQQFGAKGDCRRVSDGAMSKGSYLFISAAAHFTKDDIGRPIYILQAGAQVMGDLGEVAGAPLSSHIVSVIDASTVALADTARQDVSRAQVCWGADDSQAIQQAIDSLADTGGTVYFPPGVYRVTYQGGPGLHVGFSNIHLQGSGVASAIFNSSVLFHAKVKDGRIITEQSGVPALYVGTPSKPIENVEVDHLWLGDNGQNYNYREWGPHGWGVLGSAGKNNHFHFHDITIETTFLCGLNMDSETEGFSIHHVTVLSAGEHGFYLAGKGSEGDVHDNRIIGTTSPMRMGIAVKRKNHLRITHNEVANVEFQGISVVGDSPDHHSHDVLIADNWLHDLGAWHTEAITLSNADEVTIRNNRISDTSWIGISLRTSLYSVSNVVIKDNVITRAGQMNPCFGIAVRYTPPSTSAPDAPWPGKISDIVVENNVMTDCPSGIQFSNVSGKNVLRGNRVERRGANDAGTSYHIDALPNAVTDLTENKSVNYTRSTISPIVTSRDNTLE